MKLRRALLGLISGLALFSAVPATAQAPPPVPALPDAPRITSYSLSAQTCACAVGFALYGDQTDYQDWVQVWLNGVNVAYNDPLYGWVLSSPSGPIGSISLPITNAIITFNSAQTGVVTIVGAQRPRRLSQWSENRGVAARDLNVAVTDIIAQLRELWDLRNRELLAEGGFTFNSLPIQANRANQGFCWDNNGQPTTCVSVPGSTLSAGSGITFTGVNPTSISTATFAAGAGISFSGSGPTTINALRAANPINFYVASSGTDTGNCLTVGTACHTGQYVANLIGSGFDLGGAQATINFGTGTFCGVQVAGPQNGGLVTVELLGNGSANTTVEACTGIPFGAQALNGALVSVGSMTLSGNSISNANDLIAQQGGHLQLADANVVFATAPKALIEVFDHSTFNAVYPLNIAGCGLYGLLASTLSSIVTGTSVTNTISNTPNCTAAFVDLIDGSTFDWGTSNPWSGSLNAAVVAFTMNLNASFDTEPGDTFTAFPNVRVQPPTMGGNSTVYGESTASLTYVCIGAAASCPITDAPTWSAGTGTITVDKWSGSLSGSVVLVPSTTPTSGNFWISLPISLDGSTGNGGVCTASPSGLPTAWPTNTSVSAYYEASNEPPFYGIYVNWTSSAMTASAGYRISYQCH